MIPRSPTPALGRSRRMMLMVLICLMLFEGIPASSLNIGKIEQQQQNEFPAKDQKNSNNSEITESTNYKPDKAYRQTRALPRIKNSETVEPPEEEAFLESVQKAPSEVSSLYVIPHLRPGRTTTQTSDSSEAFQLENNHDPENKRIKYTAIPMLRYGRSSSLIPTPRFGKSVQSPEEVGPPNKNEFFDYDIAQSVKKNIIPIPRYGRSESVIPIVRFGRLDAMIPTLRFGRSSLIPTARFGRSSSLIPMARYGRSDSLIPMARYGRDHSLIPMARYGRSDSLIPMARYGRSDSLIPMARYGRSDSLIPMARYGRSDSLIPMVRYGRSDSLIPIARYGRSDSLIPMARYGRSDSLIPIPRFGKSIESSEDSDFNVDNIESEENFNENNDLETPKSSKICMDDYEAVFPFDPTSNPRLERETETEVEKKDDELKSSDSEVRPQPNESLIPQLRYGRSRPKIKLPENGQSQVFILPNIRPGRSSKGAVSNKEKENLKSVQYGLLPYPRPGRSDISQNDMEKHNEDLNENSDTNLLNKRSDADADEEIVLESEIEEYIMMDPGYLKLAKEQNLINSDSDSSRFVIPYPRPGKRYLREGEAPTTAMSIDVNSYPHLFKVSEIAKEEKVSNAENLDTPHRNKRLVEDKIPNIQLSNPNDRFQKRDNSPDKSTFLLPYPRIGRSNVMLPYPRPGRSNVMLPYPRPGRSNVMLPYPRPGRSQTLSSYPKLGRSTTVLPYPRPGRSDVVLPYPRPGRSTNVVPYPRPGKSEFIVPFPRPGRSNVILPYPRPGRSNVILPYPRPGRSITMVPIPRPGRSTGGAILKENAHEGLMPFSETEINSKNEESSEEDWLGSESSKLENLRSLVKKLNKEISTSNSVYILPYPRPGRNAKRNIS